MKHKKSIRSRLSESQNHRCCWCGEYLTDENSTIEHIIPKNNGGTNHVDNLAISCSWCNHLRGYEDMNSFHKKIQLIIICRKNNIPFSKRSDPNGLIGRIQSYEKKLGKKFLN